MDLPASARASPRGPRAAAKRIGLALAAALATVLLIEGGARLYLGERFLTALPSGEPREACAAPHPELGWVNKPGVRTRVEGPHMSYAVAINAQGLRDRDHPYAKPDGVFRVVLLGDSLAWGWGVDDGLAFADLVEEELGPGVEVVNLGVPGYGTDQELWTLAGEGRRYDPDLVLLCFILNDAEGNAALVNGELRKPRYVRAGDGWELERPEPAADGTDEALSLGQRLWLRSALLQLLRPVDVQREPAGEGGEGLGRRVPTAAQRRMQLKEQAEVEALAREAIRPDSVTAMLLGRLAEECDALQVPLVAFNIAHHHDRYLYSPTHPLPSAPLPEGELLTAASRALADAGERLGFATFSVDRAMLAATEAGVRLGASDGHLNAEGNRVVAERVVEELRPYLPADGGK